MTHAGKTYSDKISSYEYKVPPFINCFIFYERFVPQHFAKTV